MNPTVIEPQLWGDIVKMAAGAGLGTLLLVAAVWYLQRNNTGLITELKAEREQRIALLEQESRACKLDRMELQKQINHLNQEIVNIYRTRNERLVKESEDGNEKHIVAA